MKIWENRYGKIEVKEEGRNKKGVRKKWGKKKNKESMYGELTDRQA